MKLADEALKDEVRQSRDAEEEKYHLLEEIEQLRRELEERGGALDAAQKAIKNIEKKVRRKTCLSSEEKCSRSNS